MKEKRKGKGGGLSKDPEKRARQVANLRHGKGSQFVKGRSGNEAGRPVNRVRSYMGRVLGEDAVELYGKLTDAEADTIELAVLSLTPAQLRLLLPHGDDDADSETPMLMAGLIKAALRDYEDGRTDTIDALRDRQYGKESRRVGEAAAGMANHAPTGGQMTLRLVASKDELERIKREMEEE